MRFQQMGGYKWYNQLKRTNKLKKKKTETIQDTTKDDFFYHFQSIPKS